MAEAAGDGFVKYLAEHSAPRTDGAPYSRPKGPLSIDDDGDIVDANGWLVALPAVEVWPDDVEASITLALVDSLNEHPHFKGE